MYYEGGEISVHIVISIIHGSFLSLLVHARVTFLFSEFEKK